MTVLDRQTPDVLVDRSDTPVRPMSWRAQALTAATRAGRRLADPRRDAVVLLPLLLIAAVVQRIGLYSAPQRIDDEGTYVAQAWAVFHLGQLTHYTYWYDHPPLGWLQIAAWTQATGGFDRAPNAVGAGREFMLVLSLVSAGLLWVLARRLHLPRWAAALAVVLFSLSPLAVQFHRTVYLDNVATPWVLAAFVLVLSPSRRLGALAMSAVCLAVAVLSKETSLLFLPVLAWLLWHRSRGETRRYAVAVAASLFGLVGTFYVLFALLKGEVVPGGDRTSLIGGILYQLGGRQASGSIFDPTTLGHGTVEIWLQLDPVFPAVALVATLVGLLVRRLRPFAVVMVMLLAMLVRPGYLPVPFVIALIPFGALLVAGVAAAAWRARPEHPSRRGERRVGTAGILAVGLLATGAAAPGWATQLRGLTIAPLDQPMTDATAWVAAHVPRNQRILTDDALWVDLVEQGRSREDVVWFYKPDTDPDVPKGASAYSWIISTDSVRSDPASFPTLSEGLKRSENVATFGTGERRVEIRRILSEQADPREVAAQQATAATAGQQLVANPALTSSVRARDALLSGRVDARLLSLLASAAAEHDLTLADFPQAAEEAAAGARRRAVIVTAVDGNPVGQGAAAVRSLLAFIAQQDPAYRAEVTQLPAQGITPARLLVSFPQDLS